MHIEPVLTSMTFFIVVGSVWSWLFVVGFTCLWNLCICLHLSTLATWRVEKSPTCIIAPLFFLMYVELGYLSFLLKNIVGLCVFLFVWSFCCVIYSYKGKCDHWHLAWVHKRGIHSNFLYYVYICYTNYNL